jgi:hypothetical protein
MPAFFVTSIVFGLKFGFPFADAPGIIEIFDISVPFFNSTVFGVPDPACALFVAF